MTTRLALALVVLMLALGGAACGGDDETGSGDTATLETTTDETTTAGRAIFTDNCGSCHVLADAGTAGPVGPDLDEASLDVDGVEQQVREGGGGMPAFEGQLSDEEIEAVSTYVVSAQQR